MLNGVSEQNQSLTLSTRQSAKTADTNAIRMVSTRFDRRNFVFGPSGAILGIRWPLLGADLAQKSWPFFSFQTAGRHLLGTASHSQFVFLAGPTSYPAAQLCVYLWGNGRSGSSGGNWTPPWG